MCRDASPALSPWHYHAEFSPKATSKGVAVAARTGLSATVFLLGMVSQCIKREGLIIESHNEPTGEHPGPECRIGGK